MKRALLVLLTLMSFLFGGRLLAQVTANFTALPVTGCAPIVVQFTSTSTGSPVSWLWDLGNGTTSTLQNPSKTYTTPGTYSVTLTVTDAAGTTNTKTVSNYITIVPKPVVAFTASDTLITCAPKTVTFTPQIIAGTPGTVTYNWDFGDGILSTLSNPTHTYTTAGNFTVTLIATNAPGL